MTPPPSIDAELIRYLGELAKLSLPPERSEKLRQKLTALVEAFASLDAADLPEDHAAGAQAGPGELRADRAEPAASAEAALQNAPRTAADSFVVPRVVEP